MPTVACSDDLCLMSIWRFGIGESVAESSSDSKTICGKSATPYCGAASACYVRYIFLDLNITADNLFAQDLDYPSLSSSTLQTFSIQESHKRDLAMGGDLNLKKSWHLALFKNQQRTWNAEQKALQERKKIEQLRRERAEEAQIQELQRMQEAAGGTKRLDRVEWMYNGPSAEQNRVTEDMESYLLGKRRLDGLLQKQEKTRDTAAGPPSQPVTRMQDAMAKMRDDPLLLVKKHEHEAVAAILEDPVKMRNMPKGSTV